MVPTRLATALTFALTAVAIAAILAIWVAPGFLSTVPSQCVGPPEFGGKGHCEVANVPPPQSACSRGATVNFYFDSVAFEFQSYRVCHPSYAEVFGNVTGPGVPTQALSLIVAQHGWDNWTSVDGSVAVESPPDQGWNLTLIVR